MVILKDREAIKMVSRAQTGKPRRGDAVWDQQRRDKELQPNGKIVQVYYDDHEIMAMFYDGSLNGYSWDELSYRSVFQGTWFIYGD